MNTNKHKVFLKNSVEKPLLLANALMALAYFFILAFWLPKSNTYLYTLLLLGEIYHVWQVIMYVQTLWSVDSKTKSFFDRDFFPPVDVFITVDGEPEHIVEQTVQAAKNMKYPNFKVFVLNDGYVDNKNNWELIEEMADNNGVSFITRIKSGGAKAGNINHALTQTQSPYFAVFDADHVPHQDFLKKTMGYFSDPKVAFVQTPQFYKDHDENYITGGAWEQQELFFGPICNGKNGQNSAFLCGTNMILKRQAIDEVGGIQESLTEDFLTSLLIHQKGWKSVYVPEVLAEGLAPKDFLSYYKQQYRWARGALEIIFRYNPIFRKGLTFRQKMQYLASAGYFMSGVVVLLNALFPLIFLFTGLVPFKAATLFLAMVFLPYIVLTIHTLRLSSNNTFTFRAIAFSMGAFVIHIKALLFTIFRKKGKFDVTSKQMLSGNFLSLVIPHFIYIGLVLVGLVFAAMREGFSTSVATNMAWAVFNIAVFAPFILAAAPAEKFASLKQPAPETVAIRIKP